MREPVSTVRFEAPVTLRLVRVPTLEMFGWAPVMRDPARAVRLDTPDTLRELRVPRLVMLGWPAPDTMRATLAAATFPTRLLEFKFEIAEPFPDKSPA